MNKVWTQRRRQVRMDAERRREYGRLADPLRGWRLHTRPVPPARKSDRASEE